MIPLGLYRRQDVDYNMFKDDDETNKVGSKGSNVFIKSSQANEKRKDIRYVVTHPPGKTILKGDDLVFVLAQNDPSSPDTWDDYSHIVQS